MANSVLDRPESLDVLTTLSFSTFGWIGFHHASLLGKFDGFEMSPFFHAFMGYKARNVYFQFGHKGALLQNTYFTQLFLNSIRWAAGP